VYYDRKIRVITFPVLKPGDVLELKVTLTDASDYNMFGGYFGTIVPLQEYDRRLVSEVILEAPAAKKFYFNRPTLTGIKHRVTKRGKHRVYRWTAHGVREVVSEPGGPNLRGGTGG
jgi:hypothetical protein